jgi:Exportin-T
MRAAQDLKIIFDAIASLDTDVFTTTVRSLVFTALDAVDAGGLPAAALAWSDIELVLFVIYCYGEAIKSEFGEPLDPSGCD